MRTSVCSEMQQIRDTQLGIDTLDPSVDVPNDVSALQRDAFATYVEPEIPTLYRVALSLTRKPADAEDLVQDTLLRAYRAICTFDGRFIRAWLLTIMRNTFNSKMRRRRPELLFDPDVEQKPFAFGAETEPEPEEIVVDSQLDATVSKALADLPDHMRKVIELVDFNELSYQEAADLLEVPIGTVMSRLHRGRSRMRDQLLAAKALPSNDASEPVLLARSVSTSGIRPELGSTGKSNGGL